jgi:hypothetical protein
MINDTQKGKANINNKQKGRVVESYKLTVETNVSWEPKIAKSQWGWASWVMSPDFSH